MLHAKHVLVRGSGGMLSRILVSESDMLAIHISAQINQVCSQMSINSSHGQLDVV